mmetsp:Transcript_45759/g.133237  ORF Transcript_45759/g.133237 Transcript_45759/m.133237 type:complete len:344 (-) Transcript_45759:41-1072(-)
MGSSHSVELIPDQDSPTEPGQQSIISAPLDELDPPVDAAQAFAGLLDHFRRPLDEQSEAIMKSCEITENAGPDDFTVKVVVDGVKLDRYGFGRGDGMDRVRSWRRFVVDRAGKRITAHDYVSEIALGAWADEASDAQVLATVSIQMLEGPPRIEMWVIGQDGKRFSGKELAEGSYVVTDKVIRLIQDEVKAKVKARPAKAIKHAGEDSVVTDPMDAHVEYDAFFDKLVTVVKEKLEKIPEAEVEEVSTNEVIARVRQTTADGKEQIHMHTLKYCAASGEATITRMDHEGKAFNTSFRVVHKSPLVVEAWNITLTGERTAGEEFARLVQREVNEVIDRVNSWFG